MLLRTRAVRSKGSRIGERGKWKQEVQVFIPPPHYQPAMSPQQLMLFFFFLPILAANTPNSWGNSTLTLKWDLGGDTPHCLLKLPTSTFSSHVSPHLVFHFASPVATKGQVGIILPLRHRETLSLENVEDLSRLT